jgi:serine/threonine protein kinase
MENYQAGQGKIIGNYVLEKVLGKGQFGKVWRARHRVSQEIFAVKVMDVIKVDSNPILKKLLKSEVSIMHDINHHNILHLFEFLKSKENYYLVIQFCNQGDMEQFMKNKGIKYFEEKEAVLKLKQIMNGFAELRSRKILHRDFKLANIFMHNDQIIIGDFGFAKSGVEVTNTKLGSPLTMAPELLFVNDDETTYNSKADLWSIGVVFYQLLFGTPPFFGLSIAELIRSIKQNCGDLLKFPRPVADETKNLLRRMLTKEPRDRIEWSDFFDHPIFDKFTDNPVTQSEIDQILDEIGRPSNLEGSKVSESIFKQNQQKRFELDQGGLSDLDGISPHDVQNLAATKIEERVLDENERKQILNKLIVKEISYRYSHEKNKIMFIVFTVKRIQKLLMNDILLIATEVLMNLSMLALKKAIMLNDSISCVIISKVNVFSINPQYFSLFVQSPESDEIAKFFATEKLSLAHYLTLIQQRTAINGLPVKYHELIAKPVVPVQELNRHLEAEIENLKSFVSDAESAKNSQHSIFMGIVLQRLRFILNLEKTFPYISDAKAGRKFDWVAFLKEVDNHKEKL